MQRTQHPSNKVNLPVQLRYTALETDLTHNAPCVTSGETSLKLYFHKGVLPQCPALAVATGISWIIMVSADLQNQHFAPSYGPLLLLPSRDSVHMCCSCLFLGPTLVCCEASYHGICQDPATSWYNKTLPSLINVFQLLMTALYSSNYVFSES